MSKKKAFLCAKNSKIANILSADMLKIEYLEKNKSDKQIGNKYGFHENSIKKYRNALNIKKSKTSNKLYLTAEQKEIINGIVLSNNYINFNKTLNICYPKNQYGYANWLYRKLPLLLSDLNYKNKSKIKLKINTFVFNKKQLSKFLNKLTPLALCIWFCSDGNLINNCNYIIFTHKFSLKENKIFKKYFKNKWKISVSIKKSAKGYFLYFDNKNSIKFTNLIKYHLPTSMLYKLLPSERNHIIYLAGGMQSAPDGGIKWRRNIQQILNNKGYYCIDPTKEEPNLLLDENWQDEIDKDFNKFQKNMKKIIDADLFFVKLSDNILCLYDNYIGGGSFHEIGQSYLLNKKLYLITNKELKNISWWALGCCTKTLKSFDEFLNILPDNTKNIAYQNYVKDKKKLQLV